MDIIALIIIILILLCCIALNMYLNRVLSAKSKAISDDYDRLAARLASLKERIEGNEK